MRCVGPQCKAGQAVVNAVKTLSKQTGGEDVLSQRGRSGGCSEEAPSGLYYTLNICGLPKW